MGAARRSSRPRADPEIERLGALRARVGARLRGRPIDDVCERFLAISDAASVHRRVAGAGRGPAARLARRARPCARGIRRGCWRSPTSVASRFATRCSDSPLRARAARRTNADAPAALLDEWADSAEQELMIVADLRALPCAPCGRPRVRGARRSAGRRRRSTAPGRHGVPLARARGAARARTRALLAHEPAARGREPACRLGAHGTRGRRRAGRLSGGARSRRGARRAGRARRRRGT